MYVFKREGVAAAVSRGKGLGAVASTAAPATPSDVDGAAEAVFVRAIGSGAPQLADDDGGAASTAL